MTSTRNINSKGNYSLEQKMSKYILNNLAFYNGPNGRAANPAFSELYSPSYIPADNLSYNSTDIESELFGIGSTNLVKEKAPVNPDLKNLPTVSFFERPNIVPQKKVDELKGQRPFIV
uniref:Uncharacterized protein n=1 Tax=viral metagenome TaxID=1070528 RepID=A0A6C0AXN6_9ZZZZ|tara:strand:+ start:61 stop:414 length:354 start_codon:yes stop_codon:yes gene_type:complete